MNFKLFLTSLFVIALITGCAHQGHAEEGHEHGDEQGSMM